MQTFSSPAYMDGDIPQGCLGRAVCVTLSYLLFITPSGSKKQIGRWRLGVGWGGRAQLQHVKNSEVIVPIHTTRKELKELTDPGSRSQ